MKEAFFLETFLFVTITIVIHPSNGFWVEPGPKGSRPGKIRFLVEEEDGWMIVDPRTDDVSGKSLGQCFPLWGNLQHTL